MEPLKTVTLGADWFEGVEPWRAMDLALSRIGVKGEQREEAGRVMLELLGSKRIERARLRSGPLAFSVSLSTDVGLLSGVFARTGVASVLGEADSEGRLHLAEAEQQAAREAKLRHFADSLMRKLVETASPTLGVCGPGLTPRPTYRGPAVPVKAEVVPLYGIRSDLTDWAQRPAVAVNGPRVITGIDCAKDAVTVREGAKIDKPRRWAVVRLPESDTLPDSKGGTVVPASKVFSAWHAEEDTAKAEADRLARQTGARFVILGAVHLVEPQTSVRVSRV